MERLVSWASKRGIKIAFNPSSYQVKQGKGHLKHILKKIDVLILNKEEAEMLVGKGDLLTKLRKLGPKIVCVTNGIKGNEVYDGINKYHGNTHVDVRCVERTGAGDAFASGFVAGLIKNRGIEDAIKIGSANAESVIQYPGAKNKLLKWGEVNKILRRGAVKVKKS